MSTQHSKNGGDVMSTMSLRHSNGLESTTTTTTTSATATGRRQKRGVKGAFRHGWWLVFLVIVAFPSFYMMISMQQSEIIKLTTDDTTTIDLSVSDEDADAMTMDASVGGIGGSSTSSTHLESQFSSNDVPIVKANKNVQYRDTAATTTTTTAAAADDDDDDDNNDAAAAAAVVEKSLDHITTTTLLHRMHLCRKYQTPAGDSRYLTSSFSDHHHHHHRNDILPHGLVLRDLTQRILSRDIAQSHVLLMGSNQTSSVVRTMYQRARQERHEVHFLDTTPTTMTTSTTTSIQQQQQQQDDPLFLDSWWNGLAVTNRPKWLLLTVLDHPNSVFSSPRAASTFLTKGPTMTYIVFSVTAGIRNSSKNTTTTTTTDTTDAYFFQGMDTVTHLLNHHYKVQLLSASDFWSTTTATTGSRRPESLLSDTAGSGVFLPNSLITKENMESFFVWGAQAAATSRACVVMDEHEVVESNADDANKNRTSTPPPPPPPLFKAFLFATQGLDLAIPSRREYLNNSIFPKVVLWDFPYNDKPEAQRDMVEQAELKPCPQQDRLQLEFKNETRRQRQDGPYETWDVLQITCDGQIVTNQVRAKYNLATVWVAPNAESACVKLDCNDFLSSSSTTSSSTGNDDASQGTTLDSAATAVDAPVKHDGTGGRVQVACTTRIIPKKKKKDESESTAETPNILVVMIDPISRTQFDFIMPQTKAYLQSNAQYTGFSHYSTVGNNSGPNQAALYSGKMSKSHDSISEKGHWIWDRLEDAGYATFKAEDGCIANSNMVQSMMPNTTHGQALHDLYCFHFARPNCVGNSLAANYLFDHAVQFIEAYSTTTTTTTLFEEEEVHQQPWAAFLSLVDTHEDTMTLGRLIDNPLMTFLQWFSKSRKRLNNTLVVVLSDHGLHYGPYFQSKAGRKERSEPILYIRLPDSMPNSEYLTNLRHNADKFVTPFDVHESILRIAAITSKTEPIGKSLLTRLPPSRMSCKNVLAIPASHCQLIESFANSTLEPHVEVPSPPSLLSFFADIPRDHRWKIGNCNPKRHNIRRGLQSIKERGDSCSCSTSHRDWYPCREHPWNNESSVPNEFFMLADCPRLPLLFDVRVLRDEELVAQLKETNELLLLLDNAKTQVKKEQSKPNILVIEIDSVSTEHANRHMPLTRELLQKHRIGSSSSSSDIGKCLGDLCAVEFSKFAVVGPNSISNQVASLSGCITTLRHPTCFNGTFDVGDVCTDPTVKEFGLQLYSNGPKRHRVFCPVNTTNPFLYDIARENGFVTFFGEEFCYPGSPWVVQDNVFPLKADILLHEVFCRLARKRNPKATNLFLKKVGGRCVAKDEGMPLHEIGLDVIRRMWEAYRNVPKFAFFNSMVSHEYTNDTAKVAILLEAYDVALSKFLLSLLEHEEALNTIIVLRSDHGLQGGEAVTVDYSTQIEQRHPWTEVIVPRQFPVENLVANSDKVVTPHDLYTMLKELMTGRSEVGRPQWRHNMLYDTIPTGLTCDERKIPLDFCPSFDAPWPNFGICNSFEISQSIFCRDPWFGAKVLLNQTIGRFGATAVIVSDVELQSSPEQNACEVELSDQVMFAYNTTLQLWNGLDVLVETNRKRDKVSGGIFLYPRQSLVFLSILLHLESKVLASETDMIRVCETGFGAGHSAALFLQSSDRVELVTFDRFDRSYQPPALQALGTQFGWNRLTHIVGDTCDTVPTYFEDPTVKKCDVIHGSSFCPNDMKNLIRNLRPNGIVTATAMNSLDDASVYFGEEAQWRQLRQEGCLSRIQCWKEQHGTLVKDFVFAKKGSAMEHAFCVAINTGQCSSSRDRDGVGQVMHDIDFGQLCTNSSRVPVPE